MPATFRGLACLKSKKEAEMPMISHDLIFLGLTALAAFVGARLGTRGKSNAAEIARLRRKLDLILSHLGLTGDITSEATAPVAGIGNPHFQPVTGDIADLIWRGRR